MSKRLNWSGPNFVRTSRYGIFSIFQFFWKFSFLLHIQNHDEKPDLENVDLGDKHTRTQITLIVKIPWVNWDWKKIYLIILSLFIGCKKMWTWESLNKTCIQKRTRKLIKLNFQKNWKNHYGIFSIFQFFWKFSFLLHTRNSGRFAPFFLGF